MAPSSGLTPQQEARLAELEAREGATQEPTLPQMAGQAAKSLISAPISAGKALLTDPLKVAAETPVLPLGGAALGGPIGGAAGQALKGFAEVARGAEAPHPLETGLKVIGASLVPSAGRAIKATGQAIRGGTRAALGPSVEEARASTLELLGNKKLKDIAPIVFDRGERAAAVNYAETQAKLAAAGKLTAEKLQEARATLKDILDNKVVAKGSPTGQTVSRAKETVTNAFKKLEPEIGKAFERTQQAERSEMVRKAFMGLLPRVPIIGPMLQQGKRIAQVARQAGL